MQAMDWERSGEKELWPAIMNKETRWWWYEDMGLDNAVYPKACHASHWLLCVPLLAFLFDVYSSRMATFHMRCNHHGTISPDVELAGWKKEAEAQKIQKQNQPTPAPK